MRISRLALGLTLAVTLTAGAWAAPNWKSLTDAPRNTEGAPVVVESPVQVRDLSNHGVVIALGRGWTVNQAGQMGADREFYNEAVGARLGVWAGDSIKGSTPRNLVNEWVKNIKDLTGGNWSTPKATTIAGVPVVQASGYDAFGNYYYRVVSYTRFKVNYAFAMRCDYSQRWNRQLAEDMTRMVTDSHVSTAGFHNTTNFR